MCSQAMNARPCKTFVPLFMTGMDLHIELLPAWYTLWWKSGHLRLRCPTPSAETRRVEVLWESGTWVCVGCGIMASVSIMMHTVTFLHIPEELFAPRLPRRSGMNGFPMEFNPLPQAVVFSCHQFGPGSRPCLPELRYGDLPLPSTGASLDFELIFEPEWKAVVGLEIHVTRDSLLRR